MALLLNGKVDASGAQIAGLDLTANDKQSLKLTGSVDWSKGLTAQANINWQDFPWHRLYNEIDEPQVALRTFTGEVSYTDGQYIGNFAAALDGPAGRSA